MSFTLNNIDRSNWKSFPLEKIAKRISESVDPKTTDLEVYYGLEHLDGETIHIRRNGTPDDVSGGKLKCYPGDLIFGKRRAYQRKAGIVRKAGICSAHAFVFRANEEVIDVKLFPFFMHSDQFMHRMVDISVGGLSPTINWSDLKHQDFLLPPKEKQAELAELLWAMDNVIEKDLEVLERLEVLYNSQLKNIFIENSYNATEVSIKDLGTVSTSGVDKKINPSEEIINLVNYMDVYGNKSKIIDSSLELMKVSAKENQIKTFQVHKGDVLFTPSSETKDDIGHSCVVAEDLEKTLYSYHLVRLSFNEEFDIDLNFKRFMFNNPKVLNQFTLKSKGVTRMTLSLEDFYSTLTLLPKINEQKDIAVVLNNSLKLIKELETKLQTSKALQNALINQIF